MAIQKCLNLRFVFVSVISTGRIEQSSARNQHFRGIVQKLCLHGTVEVLTVFQPSLDDRRVLSEHALSGAGGIDQNAVKIERVFSL